MRGMPRRGEGECEWANGRERVGFLCAEAYDATKSMRGQWRKVYEYETRRANLEDGESCTIDGKGECGECTLQQRQRGNQH